MRFRLIGTVLAIMAGPALAQAPSPATPTPGTTSTNPGAAATDAVTSPAKPTEVAPPLGSQPAPSTPPPSSTPVSPSVPPGAIAPGRSSMTAPQPSGDMRELIEAARAIVKSTGETVEYGRVVPDLLTQILAKLDKIENKLDKVENAVKAAPRARR